MPLHSADRVVELAALVKAAGMVGGAVAGAAAGWMSKRSPILALCACLLGIIGGLLIGSLMGMLFSGTADGGMISVCPGSLCPAITAGLAGSLPTSFLVGGMITLLALRHVRQRPPPYRTGFKAFACGVIAGTLVAVGLVYL
jgi:hypothetical protein